MSFNAGSIVGTAKLDSTKWTSGQKVLTAGLAVVGVATAAVSAYMVKATKNADDWQKSLSNVSTMIDTSAVSMQDMSKQLINLDADLGNTKELTDATYQAFSSGAATMDEAIATTVTSAQFARAALTDTSTAVDVLTTAQNAYGKETVSVAQASDIFFTTIKQGKITGEELSSTIGNSIPLFASMDISLEELSSGIAAMTKQGVDAASATTQLNAIVNSFISPSAAMTAALEEQGYASGSALLEAEGLSGALEFLETATGGSKEGLAELLPNTRAVRGALALTGEGGEAFNAVMVEMQSASGATAEAFGKQELTWDTLANQMDKVSLVAGNVGKYFVDDIAGGATTAAAGVLTFLTSASGMEIVGNIAASTAGAFSLLKEMISPIVEVLGDSWSSIMETSANELSEITEVTGGGIGAFDLLGGAVNIVSGILRIHSLAITETIGNLSTFIESIKASAETVGTFFDFLKGDASWTDVKENASAAGEVFKTFGSDVVSSFKTVGTSIMDEVSSFTEHVDTSAIELETSFTTAFDNTKSNVTSNWDEMITGQETFVETMLEGSESFNESLSEQDEEQLIEQEEHIKALSDMWGTYWDSFELGWSEAISAVGSAISTGLSDFSTVTSLYYANQLDEVTNTYNAEQALLDEKYAAGLLSETEYEAASALIEAEALAQENAIGKKQFKAEQAVDIANVWMDAASATAGWWQAATSLGPIAGPIFAGVMTGETLGMAGVQSSLISKQQYVTAYADGGMASGTVQVNEEGGEIITLPDGSQVVPNDISQQIAANSSSGGDSYNFTFNNPTISDSSNMKQIKEMISRELGRQIKRKAS